MHRRLLAYKSSAVAVLPNFFIGGVGAAYLTTAAAYEALSSWLTSGDVQNFQIDASDNVSFYCEVMHELDVGTPFSNRDEMTYFIDKDGFVDQLYYFEDSQNMTHLKAAAAVDFGNQFSCNDLYALIRLDVVSITTLNKRYQLSDCRVLPVIDLRSLTTITITQGQGSVNRNYDCEYLMLHALPDSGVNSTQYEISLIRNTGRDPMFYLTGRDNVSGKVFIHADMGVKDRKAYVRGMGTFDIGDTAVVDGKTYTAVVTPSVEGEFDGTMDGLRAEINADTRTGTVDEPVTAYNDGAFIAVECDTLGTVGDSIAVSVGGSNTGSFAWDAGTFDHGNDVHVMIQELRDQQGMSVVEVAAPIAVNVPTGLSASSITASGFDLNFTAPAANANGTELYEVWVVEKDNDANPKNHFYYQHVTATGETISGLDSGKTYVVHMRTMDGHAYYSADSISFEVTTL